MYQKLNTDTVYNYLLLFSQYYEKFTDFEKKELMNSILEKVEIYEQQQEDSRIIKALYFKFPVYWDGTETKKIILNPKATVETAVKLARK